MQLVDLNLFVRYDCNDSELRGVGGWRKTVDDNVKKKPRNTDRKRINTQHSRVGTEGDLGEMLK